MHILFSEKQRVVVLETGAVATVLGVNGRWGDVTILVDEDCLTDPEDDGLMTLEAGALRPLQLN